MNSEVLFVTSALIDITVIYITARLCPQRLFGTIVLNLIFISIFGAKMVTVFGLTTNVGNVFYACVFLATHFILQRQSKKETYQVIWVGVFSLIFFIGLSQIAVMFPDAGMSTVFNQSLEKVFSLSLRVTFASLLAYIFAQYINISIFEWIRTKTKGKHLWLESNGANIVAQLVDSCIFFSVAFIDLPGVQLLQAIYAGWLIKTIVVALGTPLLYLNSHLIFTKKS